ncbi:hypothetical protein Tco_0804847 [Tanacetum coccineum]
MSNTSDKGTTFGDGATRVGMQLRSSPKVSTSSLLVSPSTIINVPRELYSIDVAATFGVPLTTVGDLQKLINDIDAGKHDELLSELTNEDRMETLEALGSICNSIKVDHNNADVIPCKVSLLMIQLILMFDDSTNLVVTLSFSLYFVESKKQHTMLELRRGSAKDQPIVNPTFVLGGLIQYLMVVNISYPRKVVERLYSALNALYMATYWKKEWRFRLCSGGVWSLVDSLNLPFILKKNGRWILIAQRELAQADLVDVVTISILSLSEDDFTKETIRVEYEWRPPRCDTYNDGFQTVGKKKKRKGKSKSTNGGTTYVGYTSQSTPMLKTTGNSSKKDNLSMSNSFSALNEEEEDDEEDVENVL